MFAVEENPNIVEYQQNWSLISEDPPWKAQLVNFPHVWADGQTKEDAAANLRKRIMEMFFLNLSLFELARGFQRSSFWKEYECFAP